MQRKKPKIIVGVDEAGRGPLAGPVVAAAITSPEVLISDCKFLKDLKDSKKMAPRQREEVFRFLKQHPEVEWGIGRVSEKLIDRINILQATKLAMARAVRNLEKRIDQKVDFLLIDGNFGIDLPIAQKSIIRGDERVFLIKLASIVAKVTRDKGMLRYHKKYPQYCFDRHKGYGTEIHFAMLNKHGPCKLHRKSFGPVSRLLQN